MILLGVGWNFSFSAGTIMLTGCYSKEEATDVQAVNDFILFSVAGCGSLASGGKICIYVSIPFRLHLIFRYPLCSSYLFVSGLVQIDLHNIGNYDDESCFLRCCGPPKKFKERFVA
jgi:hypothetical protein